jgi:hypothetical protein
MAKPHIYFNFEPEVKTSREKAIQFLIGTVPNWNDDLLQFHLDGAVKGEVYELADAIMKEAESRGIALSNPVK